MFSSSSKIAIVKDRQKIRRQNLSSKVITLAPVSNVHVLVSRQSDWRHLEPSTPFGLRAMGV
jgi:hypothetical protein